MISQQHRFHGHNSLKNLFTRGRTMKANFFTVRHTANHRGYYRLAVIVSKKIDKRAVIRNRIRRRLYELLRRHLAPNLKTDVAVIVANKDLAEIPVDRLESLFQPVLKELASSYQ